MGKKILDGKKELIKSLLKEYQWNVTEVARQLRKRGHQISRSGLWTALDRWDWERPETVTMESPADLIREWEPPSILNKKVVTKAHKKELWNAIQHMQQAYWDTSILQDEAFVELNFNKPVGIANLADLHLGGIGVTYDYILDAIDMILGTQGCYVSINGDIIDNFIWGRGTQFEELASPRIQKIMATEMIKELFGITIWLDIGCHEEFSKRADDFDFMEYLATHSRGAFLGHVGDIFMDVSGAKYHIHSRHRYKYESSLNIENAFRRMYDFEGPFDVGVIAHMHHPPFIMHLTKGSGLGQREVIYVRPGTAKVYDRYTRHRYGTYKAEFAVPMVIYMPEQQCMIPFKHLNTGLHILDLLRKDWERNEGETDKILGKSD